MDSYGKINLYSAKMGKLIFKSNKKSFFNVFADSMGYSISNYEKKMICHHVFLHAGAISKYFIKG